MMKKLALVFAALVVALAFNSAWAEDYYDPPWERGSEGTTYQRWEFMDGGALPSAPELDLVNPLGVPTLMVTDDLTGPGATGLWMPNDGVGRDGVWKFEDMIVIDILNFNQDNPRKEIWIQITYDAIGVPLVYADDPSGARFWGELVDETPTGDNYLMATWHIIMQPNPDSETIYIQPRNCTTFVDEIVIDTICIPEPVTVCFLGLGALVLLRKRRP
jgi:hypothetical protein